MNTMEFEKFSNGAHRYIRAVIFSHLIFEAGWYPGENYRLMLKLFEWCDDMFFGIFDLTIAKFTIAIYWDVDGV